MIRYLTYGAAVTILLSAFARPAMAGPTKDECIASSEAGQKLRHDGRLRDARAPFRKCSDETCPGPVRDDCRDELAAVAAALPAMQILAKDSDGEAVPASVSMDGEDLNERDARGAWVVDPGEHSFVVTGKSGAASTRRIVIASGERSRVEVFTFDASARSTQPHTERRFIGYGLAGVGIAGIVVGAVFGILAKSTYDDAESHCPAGPASCDTRGVDSGESAHNQATVSTVAFIAGTAFLVGGTLLILKSPSSSSGDARISAGLFGAGIRLQGAW